MPDYFSSAKGAKKLQEAWTDLHDSADEHLRVPENRFTFEMASVLLAKFRSGKVMSATESKELKRYMVQLGLAKGDEAPGKRGKNDRYFETP